VRKKEELTNPKSCLSRAADDEMIFVLLGRDVAAPAAIHAWVEERIRLGKNRPGDSQIVEAYECLRIMEQECPASRAKPADEPRRRGDPG